MKEPPFSLVFKLNNPRIITPKNTRAVSVSPKILFVGICLFFKAFNASKISNLNASTSLELLALESLGLTVFNKKLAYASDLHDIYKKDLKYDLIINSAAPLLAL